MSDPVFLLDGNVLVSIYIDDHPTHHRALAWFDSLQGESFATCAVTEGTLLRMHMMHAQDKSASAAWDALRNLRSLRGHCFWDAGFSYAELSPNLIRGHRQITDAWLVELARRREGTLATLDAALATLHPEVVKLIPFAF